MISLSVLVPVYNEQFVAAVSLRRLELLEGSQHLSRIEVIVVDDASRDGTPEVLAQFAQERAAHPSPKMRWTFLRHERNSGKGAAVRTALAHATGDVTVIHDADLEYHPKDLLRIARVFVEEPADAVFGSRFAGAGVRRVLLYRHQLGNKLLTLLCNLATNLNLTDMETCYKAVRTPLLRSIPLVSDDFRLEPELTIKLAKRRARIFEVPISYSGRTYEEGKKINWKDGFRALLAILRFTLSDRVYREDEYGSQILARLARAPRFCAWLADTIRPYLGERVLEIGSGVGNLTQRLIPRRHYVASDINPLYLQALASLQEGRPYLTTSYCDVTQRSSFPALEHGYDTVVCLNVLEHVADDRAALDNIRSSLSERGRAILLVPQGRWNYGSLDRVLGHQRRYGRRELLRLAADCGFEPVRLFGFNRAGTPAWFLNGKILRRRTFGLAQITLLNWLTPLLRLLDYVPLWPSLSLIVVLERRAGEARGQAAA
jgi:glycosyltransferase involved in cell wall biosynthesis